MQRTGFGSLLAVGAAAALLWACGPSPQGAPASSSPPTSAAPPSTTVTTAGTAVTMSAVATCQPGQLRVVESGSGGAAGTGEVTFSLTDTGGPCTMHGYPGLLLLGAGGAPLPTTVERGGGLAFENVPVATVSLVKGQVAYFNLGYTDVGPSPCVTAAAVEVTPPNDFDHAVVNVSPPIDACKGGTLNVSPVFAAADAAAQTMAP